MGFTLLLIVASAVQLGIGIAIGLWLRNRDAQSHPVAPVANDPPPLEQPHATLAAEAEIEAEEEDEETSAAGEILSGLQEFTRSISEQVVRHSSRVESITQHLAYPDDDLADEERVRRVVAQLIEANEQLKTDLADAQSRLKQQEIEIACRTNEARTDQLTGLANRRAFDEQLARRVEEWRRRGTPVSLMIVDVDHFKQFNDTHGHLAGDRVLQGVAQVLRDTMRDMDVVARHGGEEFAVILASTTLDEGQRATLRALKAIGQSTFHFEGTALRVTASIGLAEAAGDDDTESLVQRADAALYASKEAGRNCGHMHQGAACEIICEKELNRQAKQDRRGHRRRPFNLKQQIAAYQVGHPIPAKEQFHTVQCLDISTGGFSFLADSVPQDALLVVALGVAPSLTYMTASVTYSLELSADSDKPYRVGCRFHNRIKPNPQSDEPVAVDAPIPVVASS